MKRQLDYRFLERAAKIGELLTSNHDGEVVNAARALNSFLRAEGLTFTELLSNVVVEKTIVREVAKYRDRPFAFYKKLAVKIHQHPRYLTEDAPQQSFIENMLNPAQTYFHGKQQTWMLDIANRLGIDTEAE